MKKKALILLVLSMLTCASCEQYSPPSSETILDSLRIHTWVLDEQYEDNGIWMYEERTRENGFNKDAGYWLTDEGERLTGDDVFVYDRLELGVSRIHAPIGFNYLGVYFHIDWDGYVEIELTDESNPYATLLYGLDEPEEPWMGDRIESNNFRSLSPMSVEINPIGKFHNLDSVQTVHTLSGQTYYISIRAFDNVDRLVIEAKLKLTSIDDEGYPYPNEGTYSSSGWSPFQPDDNLTRFMSVELIEYGFSEQYRMEYGIPDSTEAETTDIMVPGY